MLQKIVMLSSYKAEYMASKDVIKESIYLHNVLKELNKILKLDIFDDKPPILLFDNQSAIKLEENVEFHKRTKHIHIQYHFI